MRPLAGRDRRLKIYFFFGRNFLSPSPQYTAYAAVISYNNHSRLIAKKKNKKQIFEAMRIEAIQRQWFHKNHAIQGNVEVFYLIGVREKKEKIIIIMNEWNENTSALPLRGTKGKRKYFHIILLLSTQFSVCVKFEVVAYIFKMR